MAEHKILGLILAAGLVVVAAIFWFLDDEKTAAHDPEGETVAVAPPDAGTSPGEQTVKQEIRGEPLDEAFAGKILVAKRPVQVLAAPSASASAMFGFPAGRPFRAISQQDGYIRIQDVKSGASGWIEEAALAPAPTKPVVAPSSASRQRSATSGGQRPTRRSASDTASVEPEPAPAPKRRGIFSGGGIFGGLFGGR